MSLNYTPGNVYWITGLAGSGKTTLGKALYYRLKSERDATVFLDGDTLREILGDSHNYSLDARKEKAYLYGRLCAHLAQQGLDVICCTISMFHEVRDRNRVIIDNYLEIFIDTEMAILKQRDQKGLYSTQDSGQVMGLGLVAEFPKHPDVHFKIKEPFPDISQMLEHILEKTPS